MMVLGITGGVGAGKSTVLDYMKEKYQAVILQADLAAHDLMQKGADCYDKIVETFGTDIAALTASWTGRRWQQWYLPTRRCWKS